VCVCVGVCVCVWLVLMLAQLLLISNDMCHGRGLYSAVCPPVNDVFM